MARGIIAYGERMWLTTAISEIKNPEIVEGLFEKCWEKTTSRARVNQIRKELGLTGKAKGGARPYLSDKRMREIYDEFADDRGINIIQVASLTRKTPQRLIDKCEEMEIPYYNVPKPRSNGNGDFLQNPNDVASLTRVRFYSGNGHH